MASRIKQRIGSEDPDQRNDADHHAFVEAKVRKGLAQSRDRATMVPIEQVWRNLSR